MFQGIIHGSTDVGGHAVGTSSHITKCPKQHFPIRELLLTFDKLLILESNCQADTSRVLDQAFGLRTATEILVSGSREKRLEEYS